MVRFIGGLLLFSTIRSALAFPREQPQADQQVLTLESTEDGLNPRKLQGRFLHMTDLHPDYYYKPYTTKDEACHWGEGHAGIYGHELTECDSPLTLINATFQWIKENVADKIDFIIWTGDSARHDNDESMPRSDVEVVNLNRYVVEKFVEVFGKEDNINDTDPTNDFVVPIIPTFGNNDILPHNILEPGPNRWTRYYSNIWDRFIPEEQRHSFGRGGWFYTEVIPGKLAVFSLNTLYFFSNNAAVDGCDKESEPGYEHFEWLRVQLQFLRQRGMKAIMSGHVPPARTESKQSWDETCWQKYTLWMRQYRDVIVGQIFGHANIEHFMFQDMRELKYDLLDEDEASLIGLESDRDNEAFSIQAKDAYLKELRKDWSELPKPPARFSYLALDIDEDDDAISVTKQKKSEKDKREKDFLEEIGGKWAEHFSLSLVSASVVPNFFPTLRIIEYNMTGLEHDHPKLDLITPDLILDEESVEQDNQLDAEGHKKHKKNKKNKKHKKHHKSKGEKPRFKVPKAPSKSAPPGPAHSPQTFSFLSYVQYYANLTRINALVNETGEIDEHSHSKYFKYEVEYDTKTDKKYDVKDLTVRNMLDLARKIGEKDLDKGKSDRTSVLTKVHNPVWRAFVKRAFVQTKSDETIDEEYD